MVIYLDCNSTTPVDSRVQEEILRYLAVEFGNAGSTTHEYGERARRAVHRARDQIGAVVGVLRHEIIFTSGATESNNLAILGLAPHGEQAGKRHIVSTQIEHKAVLEPLEVLARRGFEITLVPPNTGGWVEADAVCAAVRSDTLLVSIMQVNNETGVRQPIDEIAGRLADLPVFLHVDAAQGFGKELRPLAHPRIDLISISGHKIYGPKGIGALVVRRRGFELPPLSPLMYGGGQELGLRPGTLPVHLIVGLGKAAELAHTEHAARIEQCKEYRRQLLQGLSPLAPRLHGDPARMLPHVVNLSFPSLDAEQTIGALRDFVAISDGAACTSTCATASHVLTAMGLPCEQVEGAVRFSWSHNSELPDLHRIRSSLLARIAERGT